MNYHLPVSAVLAACLALAGCATRPPMPPQPLPAVPAEGGGEILVYRESAFGAGGVALSVSVNDRHFANLDNAQLARARLPAGSHEVHVQAGNAEPTRRQIKLAAGQTVCVRTSANIASGSKSLLPTATVHGYHFYLDQKACPAPNELKQYKDVPVAYE